MKEELNVMVSTMLS